MKTLVKKYFPIPLALLLVAVCCFTISAYNKNHSEYALISFESQTVSADLYVSQSGKIVKAIPANSDSNETLANIRIEGEDVSRAVLKLSEYAKENETVFVGAYLHEDKADKENSALGDDYSTDYLKSLAEKATASLTVSVLSVYGTYTDYDATRAISNNVTTGKMAYVVKYSDVLARLFRVYVGSYDIYESKPYDLYFYAEYSAEHAKVEDDSEVQKLQDLLGSDFSKIKKTEFPVDLEQAANSIESFIKDLYKDNIKVLTNDIKFRLDEGRIVYVYEYEYEFEDDPSFVVVDAYSGETNEIYPDEY